MSKKVNENIEERKSELDEALEKIERLQQNNMVLQETIIRLAMHLVGMKQ